MQKNDNIHGQLLDREKHLSTATTLTSSHFFERKISRPEPAQRNPIAERPEIPVHDFNADELTGYSILLIAFEGTLCDAHVANLLSFFAIRRL